MRADMMLSLADNRRDWPSMCPMWVLTLHNCWQRPFWTRPPKGFSSPERLPSLCGGYSEALACGGKGVSSSYRIVPRTRLLVLARLLSEATWFLSTGGLTTRHWCQWVRR
jgi:hypothetical protein